MTQRTLASIQDIKSINIHPNADKLEIVKVLGWNIIVGKNFLTVGEKIVYMEIDSMIPKDSYWLDDNFKQRSKIVNNNYKVRTVRLRGEYSQGMIFKLTTFDDKTRSYFEKCEVGTDVTDLLGITKYESGVDAYFESCTGKNEFPINLLPKTSEPRIQSNSKILNKLVGTPVYISVKLDGTSATYLINNGKFDICTRNLSLNLNDESDKDNKYIKHYIYIAEKLDIENKLRSLNMSIAIQGEICGPNLHHNLLNLEEPKFFVFNVVDLKTHKRYNYLDFMTMCEKLNLETVPISELIDNYQYSSIEELLKKAEGKYEGTKNNREGLVIRNRENTMLSVKVISQKYLIDKNKNEKMC